MRTTDGRSARAAAENADDSTRASLGACVLGVTVLPGASEGGGGSAGPPPGGAASPGAGAGARREQPVAAATIRSGMTTPDRNTVGNVTVAI